jgi:hypothetical protein
MQGRGENAINVLMATLHGSPLRLPKRRQGRDKTDQSDPRAKIANGFPEKFTCECHGGKF